MIARNAISENHADLKQSKIRAIELRNIFHTYSDRIMYRAIPNKNADLYPDNFTNRFQTPVFVHWSPLALAPRQRNCGRFRRAGRGNQFAIPIFRFVRVLQSRIVWIAFLFIGAEFVSSSQSKEACNLAIR